MYSTVEAANILHLSRIAVFQKIQSGEIKAQKVGRNYVIPYESLEELLGKAIGTTKKEEIEKAIDRALIEYGDVFKQLGKE